MSGPSAHETHLRHRPGPSVEPPRLATSVGRHEAYLNEEGLVEHNVHVMEARAVLFEKYAFDHQMTAFGEVSQGLRDLATKHAGGVAVYGFFQGLDAAAAV
jgi:hypothetical protein